MLQAAKNLKNKISTQTYNKDECILPPKKHSSYKDYAYLEPHRWLNENQKRDLKQSLTKFRDKHKFINMWKQGKSKDISLLDHINKISFKNATDTLHINKLDGTVKGLRKYWGKNNSHKKTEHNAYENNLKTTAFMNDLNVEAGSVSDESVIIEKICQTSETDEVNNTGSNNLEVNENLTLPNKFPQTSKFESFGETQYKLSTNTKDSLKNYEQQINQWIQEGELTNLTHEYNSHLEKERNKSQSTLISQVNPVKDPLTDINKDQLINSSASSSCSTISSATDTGPTLSVSGSSLHGSNPLLKSFQVDMSTKISEMNDTNINDIMINNNKSSDTATKVVTKPRLILPKKEFIIEPINDQKIASLISVTSAQLMTLNKAGINNKLMESKIRCRGRVKYVTPDVDQLQMKLDKSL